MIPWEQTTSGSTIIITPNIDSYREGTKQMEIVMFVLQYSLLYLSPFTHVEFSVRDLVSKL